MSLLTWLGLRTEPVAYDALDDGHSVSDYALSSFHSVIDDLNYANKTFEGVKQHAFTVIREHEQRAKSAVTRQQQNSKIISKIEEFLGVETDAGNEGQETHG